MGGGEGVQGVLAEGGVGGDDGCEVVGALAKRRGVVDAGFVVEAVGVEIGGDDHGGAAGINAAAGVGGLRLPQLVIGEQVGAVVAGLRHAGAEAGVGRVVGDVSGAVPGAEFAGGAGMLEAGFADEGE